MKHGKSSPYREKKRKQIEVEKQEGKRLEAEQTAKLHDLRNPKSPKINNGRVLKDPNSEMVRFLDGAKNLGKVSKSQYDDIRNADIYKKDGKVYALLGEKEINGFKIPYLQEVTDNRLHTATSTPFYLFRGKKITDLARAQEQITALTDSSDYQIESNEEQEKAKARNEEIYQNVKSDFGEHKKNYQKYQNAVNEAYGGEAPSIKKYTEIANNEADAYARRQAQNQARFQTEQARQQALQAARTAGLSASQSALMASGNTIGAYNQAYTGAYDSGRASYLNTRSEGLRGAVDQAQNAQNQKNVANQTTFQVLNNNKENRDYAGQMSREKTAQAKQMANEAFEEIARKLGVGLDVVKSTLGIAEGIANLAVTAGTGSKASTTGGGQANG